MGDHHTSVSGRTRLTRTKVCFFFCELRIWLGISVCNYLEYMYINMCLYMHRYENIEHNTHTHTDKQTKRQPDIQTNRHTNIRTYMYIQTHTNKQIVTIYITLRYMTRHDITLIPLIQLIPLIALITFTTLITFIKLYTHHTIRCHTTPYHTIQVPYHTMYTYIRYPCIALHYIHYIHYSQTYRHTNIQTYRHTNKQTHTHTYKHT